MTIQKAAKYTLRSILVLFLFMSICRCDAEITAEKRAQIAAASKNKDIVIALVDTSGPFSFLKGAQLAIAELNRRNGVLNRKIRAIVYDDEGNLEKGRAIAREICGNKNVVAVIGHSFASVAIPASIIYDRAGILFLSPEASAPDLTQHGFSYTFRNTLSTKQIGRQSAELAHSRNYKKIIIVYLRNDVNARKAKLFYEHATKLGIEIVAQKSYSLYNGGFNQLIAEIKKAIEKQKGAVDAIFIAGYLPVAAEIIKQARAMGVTIPFLGGLGLDDLGLVRVAGSAADGTIVPSLFNPRSLSHVTRTFVRRFKDEYFTMPDTWNAQGYDAVQVLMHAIEKSDSTAPKRVSTTLRYLPRWNGVTGTYQFLQNGDITGKKLFYKEVVNGHFVYLERKSDWDVNPTTVLPDITIQLPLDNVVETIDPGLAIGKNAFEIIEQLFMGLTGFDPQTYKPVPELAVEWRASENDYYYLFRLRKDVRWSNGDKVTAHDVVWAIRRNIQLESDDARAIEPLLALKNARAIRRGYIKDVSKIGVKAIDDFTLWFELEKPCVFFPTLTGLPVYHPLPRNAIEKYAEKWTEPANMEINGPYKMVYREKGVQTILKKNSHYYEAAKVRIPQVHYFILPVNQVGLNMYKDNQLDIMGGDYLALPAGELTKVLAHPMLLREYSQQPLLYTYTYMFNPKPPLDNVLVRKAISAAINRKLLIQLIIQGGETAATTFTTPPVFGAVQANEKIGIAFNPIQARKWLAEAGYPYGVDFPEISLLHPQTEKDVRVATAIQTFLHHYLNINVRLDSRAPDAFEEALQNPADLQLFLFKARGSFPDASAWFDMILKFYSYDKIVYDPSAAHVQFLINSALARKVKDPGKRSKLFELAEKIICERECVVAPVFFGSGNYLIKKRVKDWYNMAFGGQHIRDWRLENDD